MLMATLHRCKVFLHMQKKLLPFGTWVCGPSLDMTGHFCAAPAQREVSRSSMVNSISVAGHIAIASPHTNSEKYGSIYSIHT